MFPKTMVIDPSLDLLLEQVDFVSVNDEADDGFWSDGGTDVNSSSSSLSGASSSSIGSIPCDLFDFEYEFDDHAGPKIPEVSLTGKVAVAYVDDSRSRLASSFMSLPSKRLQDLKTPDLAAKTATFPIRHHHRASDSLDEGVGLKAEPSRKPHDASRNHRSPVTSRRQAPNQDYRMLSFSLGYGKEPPAHRFDQGWGERGAGRALLPFPKDPSSVTRSGLLQLMLGGMTSAHPTSSFLAPDTALARARASRADGMPTSSSMAVEKEGKPAPTFPVLYEANKASSRNRALENETAGRRVERQDTPAPLIDIDKADTASAAVASQEGEMAEHQLPSSSSHGPSTGDILHRICSRSGSLKAKSILKVFNAIEHILQADPRALERPQDLFERVRKYNPVSKKMETTRRLCPFRYPLFLALNRQDTPRALLQVLIQHSGRRALLSSLRDGPHQETALHLLLRKRPADTRLVNEMIMADRGLGTIQDRRGNMPLHVACQHYADHATLLHLSCAFPRSLEVRNMHGRTPHDIASSRSTTQGDNVLALLTPRSHRVASTGLATMMHKAFNRG